MVSNGDGWSYVLMAAMGVGLGFGYVSPRWAWKYWVLFEVGMMAWGRLVVHQGGVTGIGLMCIGNYLGYHLWWVDGGTVRRWPRRGGRPVDNLGVLLSQVQFLERENRRLNEQLAAAETRSSAGAS